tara:strand:- start:22 stop:618 length:597 start_codon:yes stop_codon:yes gene_type:complete
MTFDPKTVYGLCNVLNRHSSNISLELKLSNSGPQQVEQLAKRIDLTYRENKTNWQLMVKNPEKMLKNLVTIEMLYKDLVAELYNVENGIQKQLSRNIKKGGFPKFRRGIREKFEYIKRPIAEVKEVVGGLDKTAINLDSIAAVEATVEIWKKLSKSKRIPKTIFKNRALKSLVKDILEVFEIKQEPSQAYRNWYLLTQ